VVAYDEVEDAMIAEFAPGSTLGHREMRQDKLLELGGRELDGNRRRCRLCWRCGPDRIVSYEDGFVDLMNRLSSYATIY
jgi:hypothetical protein